MPAPRHVFIIGAKSIGQYGGYETFVDKLTAQHADDPGIKYHVACKANGDGFMDESKLDGIEVLKRDAAGNVAEFEYHNARVFKIPCPSIGPAVAIYYDRAALLHAIRYCREHAIQSPVFYVLTCRIGPFIGGLVRQIKEVGGTYFLNPDGHEWKRSKWNPLVRRYWKASEKQMVAKADVVVCDSRHIQDYIRGQYRHSRTVYIAYGADFSRSTLADDDPRFLDWLGRNGLHPGGYYLVVGRFVPENNYETMIREFMTSRGPRPLALLTNGDDRFKARLERKLRFRHDPRIKFVGTVYDWELLKKIRENAFGYLHGHEVGGTNPSLLEAMGSTDVNLLLDVGFNREVGGDAALYWSKAPGDLAALLDRTDEMDAAARRALGDAAKARIRESFSWEFIGGEYRRLWNETVVRGY